MGFKNLAQIGQRQANLFGIVAVPRIDSVGGPAPEIVPRDNIYNKIRGNDEFVVASEFRNSF